MSFFLSFDWCLVYCRYQLASYDIKSNGFKEIYTHACKKHNLMRSKDIGYHIIQMYRSKKWARCTYNSTPNLTLDQWKIAPKPPEKIHAWKIITREKKSSLKNGHISKTKNYKNNPKVPKFSSCRGLSSTLWRKCGSTTLFAIFGLYGSVFGHFLGVRGGT